ncbi:unnamed protein product [Discula destructiva]
MTRTNCAFRDVSGSVAGIGYPVDDLPPRNLLYIAVIFIPFELMFACLIVTAKVSVLFFYRRVFVFGFMRAATTWMMVFMGVWGIANLLQFLLVCRVRNGRLDFLTHTSCKEAITSFIVTGIINGTTNLIIGLLPLYTIWSLKTVSISTRFGLTAVFVLGISVTILSAYRVYRLAAPSTEADPVGSMELVTSLSILECNLSVLCNSLPMLLPLYSYWRYRKFFAEDEDEYVSRIREGDRQPLQRRVFTFEDVTNGLPLETIYGQENVHFTAAVGPGETARRTKPKSSRPMWTTKSRRKAVGDPFEDKSDGESTRRLGCSAGSAGITIERVWTVREETMPRTEYRDK